MHSSTIDYQEATCSEEELALLENLLTPEDTFTSGNHLAEQLGIPEPTVRKMLTQLRQQGFEIEIVRNRSYRITREPEILHIGLLRYYLRTILAPIDVLYFPVIDSTNCEAERQLSYARKSPFAVIASAQTQGRGRLGREWYSASAENLYLSVLFKPTLPTPKLHSFTLWAGIYICRALQKYVPSAPLKIKWPNDLYCDGRKFAGMLTEAKMEGDSLRSIIFGLGINVNSNPNNFPGELRSSATSLYAISGEKTPLNQLTAQMLQAIHCAYETCISSNSAETLPEAWEPLNAIPNQQVTVYQNNQATTGVVRGIDASGALLLEQPDGNLLPIRAGEVTLKKP